MWTFTPTGAWQAGHYNLVAFAMLEDLAGNRIGRPFEAISSTGQTTVRNRKRR